MSRGLYGQKYSGYFADNLTFFDSATKIGSESTFTSINLGDEGSTYSWKWYGFIIPLATGTYTFQTISDDASYVYVDETQVVNNGSTHGARTRTGTINLNAGTIYLIRIYFGENAGAASMIFSWSGGSQTTVTTDLTTNILQFYPNNLPPIKYGLVGWYKGEAWNGTSWPDLSGNGNHCTDIRGTINKAGNYIYGGTGDGIRFPIGILPSTYTLFHVARYNGSTKGRIFDGTAGNWLSGFHGSKAGVAYHGYWLTATTTNFPVDRILFSTDQRNLYRGNGIDLKISSGTSESQRIGVNYGSRYGAEPSDWAVWEVIVYDRELALSEIETVEKYLFDRFSTYTNPVVPRGVNYFNPRDIVFYKNTGYDVFINRMTANTTNIEGLGSVVASASTEYDTVWQAWYSFDGTISNNNGWASANNTYWTSDGSQRSTRSLGGYSGEWLKIKFDIPLFLNYSVLYSRTNTTYRFVKTGYLLASNDDTNWSVIKYINRSAQELSFVLVNEYIQRPFKYYAIVVSTIYASSDSALAQIGEWYMNVKIPKFQISGAFNSNYFLMNMNNWYALFNISSSSNWTIQQSGSNPDVQVKLNDYGTKNSYTYIWYKLRLQDYNYLRIDFEYSTFGSGNGTTFKIGCSSAYSVGGEYIRSEAFNVNMQIYNGVNKFRVYDQSTNIAETPLIKAASDGAYVWTPVKIIYNKGIFKTWTVYHNGTLLVEYDDSDNDDWINNISGAFFGFGSRTGSATLNTEIRRFNLFVSDI